MGKPSKNRDPSAADTLVLLLRPAAFTAAVKIWPVLFRAPSLADRPADRPWIDANSLHQ